MEDLSNTFAFLCSPSAVDDHPLQSKMKKENAQMMQIKKLTVCVVPAGWNYRCYPLYSATRDTLSTSSSVTRQVLQIA